MGMKPRPTTVGINAIAVVSAKMVLSTALVAAHLSHDEVVGSHCSYCGGKRAEKSCCLLCALMLRKGLPTNDGRAEQRAASILGLPERFVLDIVSAFDKDGDTITYPEARRLGNMLRRKYNGRC